MMNRLSLLVAVLALAACSQSNPQTSQSSAQPNASQPGAAGQSAEAPAAVERHAEAPAGNPSASGNAGSSATSASATRAAASGDAGRSSAPAAPPAPAKPQFREVTIPAGTTLHLRLTTGVASDTSHVEDRVRATLARAVVVGGTTVVPEGAEVDGTVLDAKPSGRVKGRASVAFRFDRLRVREEAHDIRTVRVAREAASTKKEDVKKVGIGAGAGALIGAIAGGKKGAGIGTAIGAGAGTGVVMSTKGEEVRLAAGTSITTKLQDSLSVRVPVD